MSQVNRVKQNSFLSNNTRRSNRHEHANASYRVSGLGNRRPTIQKKQFVVEDAAFPPLNNNANNNANKDDKTDIVQNNWQSTIKEQTIKEQEKQMSCINEQDGKYWRGANWIGPMLMRQTPPQYPLSSLIPININQIAKSVFIIPNKGTEYSRDDVTWHKTWNDTFSEEQLYNMEQEEERDYQERCATILSEYRERRRKDSELYYAETGELDGFALREIEREEYDEYVKQFEMDSDDEHSDNENNENNPDYLEDDY